MLVAPVVVPYSEVTRIQYKVPFVRPLIVNEVWVVSSASTV